MVVDFYGSNNRGTFADLEQNLQNIMGVASKPKTTTTPSTPTTSAAQPTFIQAAMAEQAQAEQQAVTMASRFQVSPITEERPGNLAIDSKGSQNWDFLTEIPLILFLLGQLNNGQHVDGRRGGPLHPHQHAHHEVGTSSPSPEGSTYTTASESGGPNTIESEPGNYLSASDDPVNLVAVATPPSLAPQPPSVPTQPARTVEGAYCPAVAPVVATSYSQFCNSTEVTVIPQHTHDTLARVSLTSALGFPYFRLPLFLIVGP